MAQSDRHKREECAEEGASELLRRFGITGPKEVYENADRHRG
jgi:hypothetical protein